jgi:hypothetical protein
MYPLGHGTHEVLKELLYVPGKQPLIPVFIGNVGTYPGGALKQDTPEEFGGV